MTTPNPKNDLTTKQAAQQLGLAKADDVRNLINLGLLTDAYKDRGTWRVPQAAIDTYLQNQNPIATHLSAPRLWERLRSHPWIFWPTVIIGLLGTIALFFFAAISAGADFGQAQEQLYEWGILSRFPAERNGETLIIIATFHRPEGVVDDDIHGAIQRAIEDNRDKLDIKKVRVEIEATAITARDREAAEALGNKYDASIIIWGSVNRVELEINFLNLKQPDFIAAEATLIEKERTELVRPDDYAQFITQDLPDQISFLALFALGQSFYIQDEFDQAINLIQSAINLIPNITTVPPDFELDAAYFRLGWLYHATDQLDQAIVAYDQAIQLNPQDVAAIINRGMTYVSLADNEAAIADYDQAIQLNPQDARIFINRGVAYAGLGDYEAAITDFTQAIQFNPQDEVAFYNRGIVYRNLGDYEAAIADYDQAIQLNPQDEIVFNNRGNAYRDLGDYEAAIADYDQAIQLNSQHAQVFNNRGNAYLDLGDYEAAITDFTQAIQLDPQYVLAISNRGRAYRDLGDYEAAIADYQRYLELVPNAFNRAEIEALIQQLQAEQNP